MGAGTLPPLAFHGLKLPGPDEMMEGRWRDIHDPRDRGFGDMFL